MGLTEEGIQFSSFIWGVWDCKQIRQNLEFQNKSHDLLGNQNVLAKKLESRPDSLKPRPLTDPFRLRWQLQPSRFIVLQSLAPIQIKHTCLFQVILISLVILDWQWTMRARVATPALRPRSRPPPALYITSPRFSPKPNPKVTNWCQEVLRPRPQDQDSRLVQSASPRSHEEIKPSRMYKQKVPVHGTSRPNYGEN